MSQDGNGWLRKHIDAGGEAPARTVERVAATYIDHGADFEGALRLKESFRIDGEFRGSIESRSTVVVSETAGIEANVIARDIVVAGAIVGNVTATRQLTLRGTARIHGNIETPSIEIERGAMLNGTTRMVRPDAAARAAAETNPEPPPHAGERPSVTP